MSSTPGDTSPIREQLARWLRWAGGSVAVVLALAGCGGGDAVGPAASLPAQAAPPADVVSQAAAQQAVDRRMALPHSGALASVKPGAASDDFESGMGDWSNWGNTQVVAGAGTSGSSAMRVGTGAGGAGLTVPGIVAGTTYRFTAQVRVGNAAEKVDLGINMLDSSGNKLIGGGSVTRGPATTDGWVPVTVDLVAPANAAYAVAWVWKNAGTDYGYVDDVVFGTAGAPPPEASNMIANGGFESGMSEWSNWGNAQVVAGAGTSGSKAMQVGTGAGGAGLTIPGIVPGTKYRLTAQVRVTDPSEPVAIGFDLRSSSGGLVIGVRSPQVTSSGYTTVTVDFVAPEGSATAVVWVWKNAGSGYGYVDDVAFGPGDAPPPPTEPTAGDLVTNGGFESGMTGWVNWGNASVVAGQASEGSSALAVGTGAGGAGQDIGAIVPGTIYRLLVQAKVSDPSETVLVGVRFTDDWGNLQSQASGRTVSGTSYSAVSLDATAPPNATRAVVYVWKNASSGFAYVDDYVFGVAPDSAPPPAPPPPPSGNPVANGGFESGMTNWVNWGNASAATGQAAAGSYAAQVGTGAGGFGQDVGGIVAGNAYRLSGWVKVGSAGETGYLGVKFMDSAGNGLLERSVPFRSTMYSMAPIDVTAPVNATRALVYVWKNAGSGFAYVDEVALAPLTAASPSPEQVSSPPTSQPHAAQLATGERIVVWTSGVNGQGDVFAQVFDATGMKVGAPVAVFSAGQWKLTGVGALADGSFVVAASGGRLVAGTLETALYVQKVSSSGMLLASGGTSDAGVNGGLAGMLIAEDQAITIGFADSPIFANPDGSYVIAPVRVTRPVPLSSYQRVLVNVSATGEVVGAPAEISNGFQRYPAPVITRLGGGNFLVAGVSTITYGPAVWEVLRSTGQVVVAHNMGAAPGNFTADPQVTALADGTGLFTWKYGSSASTGWAAERIDGNGNVVATAAPPPRAGAVTGLANGGWVQTWISATQLMAQYFAVSGQPVGDVFVIAENLDVAYVPTYSVVPTSGGFVAVYTTATASGGRVDQIRFTAPSLN